MAPKSKPKSLTKAGSTYSWRKLRAQILERDKHTCHYCKKTANTVDHKVPRCKGGSDNPRNLVAACTKCNYGKR